MEAEYKFVINISKVFLVVNNLSVGAQNFNIIYKIVQWIFSTMGFPLNGAISSWNKALNGAVDIGTNNKLYCTYLCICT